MHSALKFSFSSKAIVMNSSMNIFYNEQVIGKLILSHSDDLELVYTKEWKEKGFPLSPCLPLKGGHDKKDVKNFVLNLLVSKCVIGPAPLTPLTKPLQVSGAVLPNGVSAPRPVTTTRLNFIE